MACCFHFSNLLPQEGARFAKWRNVLQMDPAKGSLRIGTPRKGGRESEAIRNSPVDWSWLIWLVVWIMPFIFPYGFVWKCRVPLNPMVLLIIIPFLNGYFFGNILYFQTNPYWEESSQVTFIFSRGVQTTKQLMLIGDFLGVILADFLGSLWPVMGIPIIQWPLLQYCLTQVFVKPIQIIWSFLVFMKLPQGCDCPILSHETSICFKHHQPQWCLGRSDVPVRHGLPQPRSMNG